MPAALLPEMTFEMLFQEFTSLLASPVHQAGAGSPLQSIMHCTIDFQQEIGLFNTRFTGTNVCTANVSMVQLQKSASRSHPATALQANFSLCEKPPGLTRAAAAKVINSMAIKHTNY